MTNNAHHLISRTHQTGASLIEIMVATLVMAIGLLGIAAMLMVSLRNSQQSLITSQVVIQSDGIMDVMRAHKSEASIGQYNLPEWTCSKPSSDTRIGKDHADWVDQLQQEIDASACGRIRCSSLSCEVGIRWQSGVEDQQLLTVSRL